MTAHLAQPRVQLGPSIEDVGHVLVYALEPFANVVQKLSYPIAVGAAAQYGL